MPRGGYRKPNDPAPVSGPGKFSKRTDGQPKKVESLDSPDMQYGDRQMIEAAQSAAPLRGAAGGGTGRRLQGEAMGGGGLPSFMFDMESANPGEPVTTGLDRGAGAGPEVLDAAQAPDDIREVVLDFLATEFQNPTAMKHLSALREEKAGSAAPMAPPTLPMGTPPLDEGLQEPTAQPV
jgi:hypothetical protein